MLLDSLGEAEVDITEVFCPGRFCAKASAFDLRPGTCLDLRTGWDANKPGAHERLMSIIDKEKPTLVIGSPKCAPFSALRNWTKGTPAYKKALREGMLHLNMVCAAYQTDFSRATFPS